MYEERLTPGESHSLCGGELPALGGVFSFWPACVVFDEEQESTLLSDEMRDHAV